MLFAEVKKEFKNISCLRLSAAAQETKKIKWGFKNISCLRLSEGPRVQNKISTYLKTFHVYG